MIWFLFLCGVQILPTVEISPDGSVRANLPVLIVRTAEMVTVMPAGV